MGRDTLALTAGPREKGPFFRTSASLLGAWRAGTEPAFFPDAPETRGSRGGRLDGLFREAGDKRGPCGGKEPGPFLWHLTHSLHEDWETEGITGTLGAPEGVGSLSIPGDVGGVLPSLTAPSNSPRTNAGVGGRAEGKGNDAAGQLSAAPPPKRGGPSPGPGSSLAWCPPPPPSPRALLCPPEHSSAPLPRDLQVNLRVSAPLSTGQRQLPGQGPLASFVQDPAGRPRPVVVASLGPSYKLSVDHDGRQRPACLCPPNPFVFG